MDQQKKQLIAMILIILKDVYDKTCKLEEVLESNSINILSRQFDPFQKLLEVLHIPEKEHDHFLNLMEVYLENEMTLQEILLEFERIEQQVETTA
jgi:hypothetical protein